MEPEGVGGFKQGFILPPLRQQQATATTSRQVALNILLLHKARRYSLKSLPRLTGTVTFQEKMFRYVDF